MVRALAGVVAALTMLLVPAHAAAAPVERPGATSGFFTYGGGPSLSGTHPVADLAAGYDVRVDPAAPHAARIGPAVATAVAQLRRNGIDVRYRGVMRAPAGAPAYGRISVDETANPGDPACVAASSSEDGVIIDAVTTPSFQDVGVALRVNAAEVTFCPPMWSQEAGYVTSIALHEMGHAIGLGHYRGTFHGRTQVMSPTVPDVRSYQSGDVAGLRYIAAETARLREDSALDGRVETWTVSDAGLAVTGWAIIGTSYQFADITVTRDGDPVYMISTGTPRPDIATRYDARWPNAGFAGARIPMADGIHTYCVRASAPTAPDGARALGCRDLSYPPPDLPPPPAITTGPVARTVAPIVPAVAVLAVVLLLVAAGVVRRRR